VSMPELLRTFNADFALSGVSYTLTTFSRAAISIPQLNFARLRHCSSGDRLETRDDRFLLADNDPLLVWLFFTYSTDANLLFQKQTPLHDYDLL
jgi:hypothetical protein